MPRRRVILLALLVLLGVATACARAPEDPSLFLSKVPIRKATTPTPRPATAPGARSATPILADGRTGVARGGTGIGHPQDALGLPILVFLDPGHGGVDQGTSGTDSNGQTVAEKVVTLAVARQTAAFLRADGIGVAMSREDDVVPGMRPSDFTADGSLLTPEGVLHDLQGRVDRANASGALVFLSLHVNAFTDPSVGGSETFYDSGRTFADENARFARLVQNHVVVSFHDLALTVPDRGITEDQTLNAEDLGALGVPYRHLIVLGPGLPGRLRPTQMPGALSEPLFLSNPIEAAAANQKDVQDSLARAYADAVEAFLRT